MPLIELYQNVKFMVNFFDHNPPHFHVHHKGTDYKAAFSIADCELIAGNKPDKRVKKIIDHWWLMNKDRLEAAWSEYCE
ncbi:TPA: DUF4160 domain-containing protein [Vibrio parahaemolyticus]